MTAVQIGIQIQYIVYLSIICQCLFNDLPAGASLRMPNRRPWAQPGLSHSWCCRLLLSLDGALSRFSARCGQSWFLVLRDGRKNTKHTLDILDTRTIIKHSQEEKIHKINSQKSLIEMQLHAAFDTSLLYKPQVLTNLFTNTQTFQSELFFSEKLSSVLTITSHTHFSLKNMNWVWVTVNIFMVSEHLVQPSCQSVTEP